MSIIELLEKVGPENVRVQYLHECALRAQKTKLGCQVTFATSEITPNDLLSAPSKIGIIVWIPKEKYTEAIR